MWPFAVAGRHNPVTIKLTSSGLWGPSGPSGVRMTNNIVAIVVSQRHWPSKPPTPHLHPHLFFSIWTQRGFYRQNPKFYVFIWISSTHWTKQLRLLFQVILTHVRDKFFFPGRRTNAHFAYIKVWINICQLCHRGKATTASAAFPGRFFCLALKVCFPKVSGRRLLAGNQCFGEL